MAAGAKLDRSPEQRFLDADGDDIQARQFGAANTLAVDLDRVALDNAGAADKLVVCQSCSSDRSDHDRTSK